MVGTASETGFGKEIRVLKYAPGGSAPLWSKRINATENYDDAAIAIAVDDNGDVYVTGDSRYGIGANQVEIRTAKLQGVDGEILYNETYRYQNEETHVNDMAINKDGHVFITGWTQGPTSGDMVTLRYDADGNLVSGWPQVYNDANTLDTGLGIAVGPSDNVYVTGQVGRGTGDTDWITIRYSGSGALQWKRYTHGTGEQEEKDDAPTDIVVDSQNNVYVCGYVYNGESNPDMGTVSFNMGGLDRWNVPGIDLPLCYSSRVNAGYDIANALDIELDNTGAATHVYVTGFGEPVASRDYITLCYAATTGTSGETWDKAFAGANSATDEAQDVSVAGDGNVYVTGFSQLGGDSDYVTIKYDNAGNQEELVAYTDNSAIPASIADSCAGRTHVTGYRNTNFDDYWSLVYTQPNNQTNIPVSFYTLVHGSNLTGNLASLQSSDESRMTIQPGNISNPTQYPVTLTVDGTLPQNHTMEELCFQLEAQVSAANAISQRVDFYNFATQSWVTMDERIATTSDTTVHLAAQYDPNEFIGTSGPTNSFVRARIMFKQTGTVFSQPWTARIDFAGWHSVD